MKLITNHPSARPGRPVFVDARGAAVEDRAGLAAALERLGWSRADLANATGYSRRTVESWFSARGVPAEALNVLAEALKEKR
jgi:ribosome-binding protein aMBF1 (putative translation factor)